LSFSRSTLTTRMAESDHAVAQPIVPIYVPKTEPTPSENPLEFTYIFSYFVRPAGKFDPEEYSQYVQPVAAVSSVQQFWNVYSFISRADSIREKLDIHFFKEGIRPVWEDPSNCKGGKYILRLKKGLASRIWENLIVTIIGEQFMVGDEICGAVCSIRNQEDIISLWNKTACNEGVTNRLRDTLKRCLNLPDNAVLEYKRHDDCLKDQSSYRHAAVDFNRR
ncbi:hypothetical protein PENTCL1PPCAC_27706, partial [Pristionchus entomophagus]